MESFDERDDVSDSNATAKYYQSHMRKFFENGHDKTKGLGEIQIAQGAETKNFLAQFGATNNDNLM